MIDSKYADTVRAEREKFQDAREGTLAVCIKHLIAALDAADSGDKVKAKQQAEIALNKLYGIYLVKECS